jgi:hypothetical protein
MLEELSFREQVALMSQAEAIASTSGAALTNILFAPPGAGDEYWYALGETVPRLPPPYDADLLVPPQRVV